MGHDSSSNQLDALAAISASAKKVQDHVKFYIDVLHGVLVKAALSRGDSQREVAAALHLSKSKVNRLASRPSVVLVNAEDPWRELDGALDRYFLGERHSEMWRTAREYDVTRFEFKVDGPQLGKSVWPGDDKA